MPSDKEMAVGFDAWLDEYINRPEEFAKEAAMITRHLKERAAGEKPSYGELCVATLIHYIKRQHIRPPTPSA